MQGRRSLSKGRVPVKGRGLSRGGSVCPGLGSLSMGGDLCPGGRFLSTWGLCPGGQYLGPLTREGVCLCLSIQGVSPGFSVWGVSLQGYVSLSKGGVSDWGGGLYAGGLCPGMRSLSRVGVSVQGRRSLSRVGVSVQGRGLC